MSDNKIKDILAQDDNREISTPPWSSVSMTVRTQNFFSFGLMHFNIYTLSILLALIGTAGYFGFSHKPVKNIDKEIIPIVQENINTPTKTTPTEKTSIPLQEATPKIAESPKELKVPAIPIVEKGAEKIQTPEKEPEVKEIIKNNIGIDSLKSLKKESPTPIKEAVKGKTFYVFETDTVIEVDTLVVDKKVKNR